MTATLSSLLEGVAGVLTALGCGPVPRGAKSPMVA